VISPDDSNRYLETVIIAPMTTQRKNYPTRVNCWFLGKDGQVVLDQIRAVDKKRLGRRIGRVSATTQLEVLAILTQIFAL
jgi:mRNA interferase MazF